MSVTDGRTDRLADITTAILPIDQLTIMDVRKNFTATILAV